MMLDKVNNDILVYPYVAISNHIVAQVAEGFLQLTGYSKEEVIGKSLQVLAEMLRMNVDISGIIYEPDILMFTKDLEYRIIQIIKGDDRGEYVVYYFGEKLNSQFEDKFPAIGKLYNDNITGVAIFKIPETILLKANQTWLNFLDKPFDNPRNSIGKQLCDIMKGWQGSTLEQIWRNVLDTGLTFYSDEYSYEFERGMMYWNTSLTPVRDGGEFKYAIEITTDITERVMQKKKLEEQAAIIRKQNEHLKAMIDNMTDTLFIINQNKKIVLYNKAAVEFSHGAKIEDLKSAMEQIECLDDMGRNIKYEDMPVLKMLQGETIKSYKLAVKRADVTNYYNVSGSPIYDDNGNVVEALICFSDITEHMRHVAEKKLQDEALIEAEKREKRDLQEVLRLKDEFLYFMSHEFKTPLAVIGAAVQALEHIYRKQMPDSAFEMIKKIKQNNLRQLRIVNNILDITRINAGRIKLKKINMDIVLLTRSIIDSVFLFAQQKGVTLEFESTVSEKIIGIDEEKYERILLNLLSNAIRFTPRGKGIFVRLSVKECRGKEMACIQVMDQGVGIPQDKQRVIFERFGQADEPLSRQAEGTGIGLYLAKLFVQHLGGSIQLESKLGEGSTFTITLPTRRVRNAEIRRADSETGSRLVETTAIEFSDIYL